MTILLYANYFTGNEGRLWGLAAVAVASGIGTVLAAVVTPAATARMPRARWIMIVLVGGGIVEIACGLPYSSVLFVVAGLPLGFSAQASKICVDTIVQEHVPDAYRGRAFSIYDLLFNVAFAAAGAFAALVVPRDGHSPDTIVAAGIGYVLAGVIYYQAARRHTPDWQVRPDDAAPTGTVSSTDMASEPATAVARPSP
jgi:MFS family permease